MNRKSGFSLIEVTLAIMVIGIGALVLFSLFPEGLEQGRIAEYESRMSRMADAIINDVRATMRRDEYNIDVGSYSYFDPRTQTVIDGGIMTPVMRATETNFVDYRVFIDFVVSSFSTNLCHVVVETYPGEFGTNKTSYFGAFVNMNSL
jgi:prepilin-type N-terminal cleavage/methylation domain-containing protein